MNKNVKILLIATLLLAGIYLLFINKPWSNFNSERKDFAISDTGSITKIFLADKRNNSVLLEKNEAGEWLVNQIYKADLQKLNLLKATLHDVEVRNPLAESEYNSTVAIMASNAIKVECYNGEKLIKTLYVGTSTPDQTGTFMMVEGSSTPFVTHIPGFVGYLTPRFNVFPIKWKDKSIFTYTAAEIAEVKITYPKRPNASFLIDNSKTTPVVKSLSPEIIIPYDSGFVRYYLSGFSNLYAEGYDEDIPQSQSDSVRNSEPYCVIELKLTSGQTKRLQVHLKPMDKRTKSRVDEATGEEFEFDTEKYFAFVDDEKYLSLIQHYTFGRLFKHAGDFVKRN